ncbi:MAG TPA: hypothetical protein VD833_23690, partial [Vicinamibacterales bacterium]|nr:hypothetical protein [Vicinamibacterales bacterium]
MPQELLRDVLRAGQANGRARRRLWLLPLSVLLHAIVLAAVVIIPLVAEVDLPTPSSALRMLHVMPVDVPAPPPPPGPVPRRPSTEPSVPFEAPTAIAEEAEPAGPASPLDVIGLPDTAGFGEPGAAGLPVVRVPDPPAPPPPVEQRPLRPGGSIREPRKIRHVPPVYPVLARTARIEGTVIL